MNQLLANGLDVTLWVPIIAAVGSLILAFYVLAALVSLVFLRDVYRARFQVAEGALWGLNFLSATTLLNTLLLKQWSQIIYFLVVFSLRTVLKRAFQAEERRVRSLEALRAQAPATRRAIPPS